MPATSLQVEHVTVLDVLGPARGKRLGRGQQDRAPRLRQREDPPGRLNPPGPRRTRIRSGAQPGHHVRQLDPPLGSPHHSGPAPGQVAPHVDLSGIEGRAGLVELGAVFQVIPQQRPAGRTFLIEQRLLHGGRVGAQPAIRQGLHRGTTAVAMPGHVHLQRFRDTLDPVARQDPAAALFTLSLHGSFTGVPQDIPLGARQRRHDRQPPQTPGRFVAQERQQTIQDRVRDRCVCGDRGHHRVRQQPGLIVVMAATRGLTRQPERHRPGLVR